MTAFARRVDQASVLARTQPAEAVVALEALRQEMPASPRPSQALRKIARRHMDGIVSVAASRAQAGDWPAALEVLTPVARLEPCNTLLAGLTAEGLLATGQPQAALRLVEAALGSDPQNGALMALAGKARRLIGDNALAIAQLRAAFDCGHAEAGVGLGLALLEDGDADGAEAAWRATVAVRPQAGDAWMHLSRLIDISADPDLLAAMDAASARKLSTQERVCLDFARGDTALRAGDGAAGFRHLGRANAAIRKASGYTPARDARLFDVIRARFGAAQSLARPPENAASRPRVVLITGLPRSGTTLVERVLAAHGQVTAGGERDDLVAAVRPHLDGAGPAGAEALAEIAAAYRPAIAAIAEGAGAAPTSVVTDKMPVNFRWIGPVLAALPEARVVHLTRDPMAVGLSIYRLSFAQRANAYAYDLADIGAYIRQERALMAFWRERWGADRLLDLDYAALTEDPDTQIRRLLDFCGLPFEEACLAPHLAKGAVRTASNAQVRKPIYRGSDRGWRAFEAELTPLAAALGDLVEDQQCKANSTRAVRHAAE